MQLETLLTLTNHVLNTMDGDLINKGIEYIHDLVDAHNASSEQFKVFFFSDYVFYDVEGKPIGIVFEYWLDFPVKNTVIKIKHFKDQTYEFENGLTDLCAFIRNELYVYAYSNSTRTKEDCLKGIEKIINKYNANNTGVKLVDFTETDEIVEVTVQGAEDSNREFKFKITVPKSRVKPSN